MATSKKAPAHRIHTVLDEKVLSPQEVAAVHLVDDSGFDDDIVLERKTNNPKLLARLLELEGAIIRKAQARKP